MADVEVDPAVRIVVTPTQSSYFAGEPFSVTITFTNTRSPEPGPSRALTHQHTHRRNAHSISSAPISRPPTSPGTPRTPRTAVRPPPRPTRDDKPGRKGLIGRTTTSPIVPPSTTGSLPALVELRRKKMLAKSLSVSIAPPDLDLTTRSGGQTPRSASFIPESPISAQLTSSISRRSDTLPLAASHPHARKHSILEGPQLQLQELVSSPISPSNSAPYTPSASSSTFSLALDPIAESSSTGSVFPYPPTPAFPLPSSPATPLPGTAPPSRTYPPRRASHSHAEAPSQYQSQQQQAQSALGLGLPPIPPRGAQSATFVAPHTELLLYAYAALAGRAVLAPLAGSGTPALAALRSALLRPARGGGSLSLQAAGVGGLGAAGPPRHRRASSFSAGLRALGGILGRGAGESAGGGGGNTGDSGASVGVDPDPEAPVPTLEVPPEMLAVDLSLAPGESRSYTYTLLLPAHLPPTYKGRTLRFSYELVVGACRASGSGGGNISRVMKVPIRVYNNVRVGRPARPYDLLWPVARRIGAGTPTSPISTTHTQPDPLPKPTVEEHRTPTQTATATAQQKGSVAELERYAARLLTPSPTDVSEEGLGVDVGTAGNGGLSGCREAVEVLTRNLKKVSYDVTKDGVTVAVLTFPKSAFRLGETVHGVVEVNWREGRGRVLQLTALLEAHESLPSTLAVSPGTPSTARYLRRVHAEHHARFVLGTLRLGFALDIPSDGSPAFGVVASKTVGGGAGEGHGQPGGLEWRVRLCLLVGVAGAESDTGTEGVRTKGLVRDADDDAGRGAWGSAWRAPAQLGVLERTPPPPTPKFQEKPQPAGWGAFLAASFLGGRDSGYHDGDEFVDEEDGGEENGGGDADVDALQYGYDGVRSDLAGGVGVGVRYGGREDGWGAVQAEMVECVVPVRVWAGNTAFRAGDVVFDV
ncbi:Rgp1-domain-containing protein [Mycena crocata]|nr:Rgp1-domain-containing protein [Mycena crocata]